MQWTVPLALVFWPEEGAFVNNYGWSSAGGFAYAHSPCLGEGMSHTCRVHSHGRPARKPALTARQIPGR